METVLFTGFPGFLGSSLLPRVLRRLSSVHALCLVQPQHAGLAHARAAQLAADDSTLRGRIRIVEGDITHAGLGLAGPARYGDVIEVFHLAAVYDLAVPRDVALRVNVEGTANVLAFAAACPQLTRFQYVSTCYVSGRHAGVFAEDMLEEGQRFNNHYEETKQLAEVAVRRAMRDGLPATIYRPAIVVGDSATGATQKFDGPYFAIQWLLRQPSLAVMPVVGDARRHHFNVVPRDFVVDAIAWLSGRTETLGHTYALADPEPLTVDALLGVLARATGRRMLRLPLPLSVAKAFIERVPGVHAVMRIPSSAVDYFVHPTRYDTTDAQAALAGSGIQCPRFGSYAGRLVDYMRAHPEVRSAAMT